MVEKDRERVRCRVSGRVQGVGFRWFVLAEARRLGLQGWVRNNPDGTVELEAAGAASLLAALSARIRQGPPAARVEHVTELPVGGGDLPHPFEIAH